MKLDPNKGMIDSKNPFAHVHVIKRPILDGKKRGDQKGRILGMHTVDRRTELNGNCSRITRMHQQIRRHGDYTLDQINDTLIDATNNLTG